MNRGAALLLIAIALAGFGLYHLLNGVAIVVTPGTLVLGVSFVLQGILALVSAYGTWTARAWTATALLALAIVIAATALIEAFVLGIIGWLWALLIAVAAIVVALLLGAYVRGEPVAA